MKYKLTSNLFKEKVLISIALEPKLKLGFVLFPGKAIDDLGHEVLDFSKSKFLLGGEVDPEEVGYYKKLKFTLSELIEALETGVTENPIIDKMIASAQIDVRGKSVSLFAVDPVIEPTYVPSKATVETKTINKKTVSQADRLLAKIQKKS